MLRRAVGSPTQSEPSAAAVAWHCCRLTASRSARLQSSWELMKIANYYVVQGLLHGTDQCRAHAGAIGDSDDVHEMRACTVYERSRDGCVNLREM